ncbi:hypothetical protein ATCC90586_006041 [Pythium insidiosum]|nr:hypothetical protein ATCC90586_006041 [Pythium insidiosum]
MPPMPLGVIDENASASLSAAMPPPAHLFVDDDAAGLAVTRVDDIPMLHSGSVDRNDVLAAAEDDALTAILGGGSDASAAPFHRQPSTTSAAAGRQLGGAMYHPTEHIIHRARARSQRHMSSPWSCCGLGLSTLLLRGLTSLVLLPSLIAGLVWIPELSVVWLCVMLVAVCAYEYAWIAFRIHYQLLTTFNWYERAPIASDESEDIETTTTTWRPPNAVHNNTNNGCLQLQLQSFVSGVTANTAASDSAFRCDRAASDIQGRARGATTNDPLAVASPLDMLEFAGSATAVTSFASRWCGGREWLAKIVVGSVVSSVWTVAMHYLVRISASPVAADVPEQVTLAVPSLTWLANAWASVLALSTPNKRSATSVLIQSSVFFGLLLNSLACPLISTSECTDSALIQPTELFAVGALLLVLFRAVTSTSPADMVLVTMLDLLGYVVVVGSLALLVGGVDVQEAERHHFANVLMIFLVVISVAQGAGSGCSAILSHLQVKRFRVLPRRLAVRLDVESLVVSVCVGIVAVLVAGALVPLPTPSWLHVIIAAIAVTLTRLGLLFNELFKRAAGIKYSSRALPGIGGALDVLMVPFFCAATIAKLYILVLAYRHDDGGNVDDFVEPTLEALSLGFNDFAR